MHQWRVEKEWVAYCPGVITSINQAYLTFSEPGDSIVVMPPVYNLFRLYAERLGRKVFASPSKSFNIAGLSMTGYCVIPNKELREPYLKQLEDVKLDEAPIPSLVATIAAYTQGAPWLRSLRKYLQGNIQEVLDFFSTDDLGIKAIAPQASFLVWLDCRALGLSQEQLMRFFTDEVGLVLSNGAAYGQGGEGFVRMNIGCPRKMVKEALERISMVLIMRFQPCRTCFNR